MPAEMRRSTAPVMESFRAPEYPPLSVTALGIIAILAFVLHLATGVALDRSHARRFAPVADGVADDGSICTSEAKPPEPIPYD